MTLIVKKFGGTSLEDIQKIKDAARKVLVDIEKGYDVVVVVSAMSGVTNQLSNYCTSITNLLSEESLAEHDVAISSGEIVSASLFALALQELGVKSHSYQSWQINLKTDELYSKSSIESIDEDIIKELISKKIVPVITGFQGVSSKNRITTLGRGGSDTTAAAVASAIRADICEIYTDVDGVFDADPRMINDAKKISKSSYEEMLHFATNGAKVLHPRAVQIAMRYNIPLKVLSSFSNSDGTLITNKNEIMEKSKITGITYNNNLAYVEIKDTAVDYIQNICNDSFTVENIICNKDNVSFTIPLIEISRFEKKCNNPMKINTKISLVSLVGLGVDQKILQKVLKVTSDHKIYAIFTSEVKISIIIDLKYVEEITKKLHDLL